ncbi:hypothetical protein IGI46_003715 [Enterococcus sp. AZ163]
MSFKVYSTSKALIKGTDTYVSFIYSVVMAEVANKSRGAAKGVLINFIKNPYLEVSDETSSTSPLVQ